MISARGWILAPSGAGAGLVPAVRSKGWWREAVSAVMRPRPRTEEVHL